MSQNRLNGKSVKNVIVIEKSELNDAIKDGKKIESIFVLKNCDIKLDNIESSTLNQAINSSNLKDEGHLNDKNDNSNQGSCNTLAYLKYADEGLIEVDENESDKSIEQVDLEQGDHSNKEEFETREDDYEDEEGSEELPYPQFSKLSFNCFKQTSPLRLISIKMISNPWFERISMMAILVNCITLGMYHPCADEICDKPRCQVLQIFDDLIFLFFAIEMFIKMIAMGIKGSKGSYWSESWNRLDFFIVVAGGFEYINIVGNINLSAIRAVRVLRPLRAINRIPSLRILVMLLLDTLPMLGNVLLLCFFVFFIFGIIGVQLWAGILRQRCFINLPANVSLPRSISSFFVEKVKNGDPISSHYQILEATDRDYICSLEKDHGMHRCQDLPVYRYEDRDCFGDAQAYSHNTPNATWCVNWNRYYTTCQHGDKNPFQGVISFDNVGMAWTAIFLVISLEGWTEIMYYIQDAHSFWDWVYFVLLIVIGSFFMINLCLVVIATQFSETKKREMERMRQERARTRSSSTFESLDTSESTNCYAELIKYIAHLLRKARRRVWKWYKDYKKRRKKGSNKGKNSLPTPLVQVKSKLIQPQSLNLNQIQSQLSPKHYHHHHHFPNLKFNQNHVDLRYLHDQLSLNQNYTKSFRTAEEGLKNESETHPKQADKANINACSSKECSKFEDGQSLVSQTFVTDVPQNSEENIDCDQYVKPCRINVPSLTTSMSNYAFSPSVVSHISSSRRCSEPSFSVQHELTSKELIKQDKLISLDNLNQDQVFERSDSNLTSSSDEECFQSRFCTKNPCFKCLSCVQRALKSIVNHRYFQRFIFLAILFNTLSMSIEYHNQPEKLTQALEISNIIFTGLFGIEMALKLIAEDCFKYISDGFNVFDGIVVIVSLMELIEETGSGLSVLRTFRLLRILKLVRFMPALKRQLVIMLKTLDNVAVFFALLVLFIFIFSILGMNLFGCKFCYKLQDGSTYCDRKNFDSLLWALVTVFQILTQEDWNVVLFNGMERTTHWAALYFVLLMTFGNYVLFNLLVAILVEGFSQEKEVDLDNLEDEDAIDKPEKLIYFYGAKDNLEQEIKLLSNPPGAPSLLCSKDLGNLTAGSGSISKLEASNTSTGTSKGLQNSSSLSYSYDAKNFKGGPLAIQSGSSIIINSLQSMKSMNQSAGFVTNSNSSSDKSNSFEKRCHSLKRAKSSKKSRLSKTCQSLDEANHHRFSNEFEEHVSKKPTLSEIEEHSDTDEVTNVNNSINQNKYKSSLTSDKNNSQIPKLEHSVLSSDSISAQVNDESHTSRSNGLSKTMSFKSKSGHNLAQTNQTNQPNIKKRFSIVHEMKSMNPGKPLTGVFYCSGLISRKNSEEDLEKENDQSVRSNKIDIESGDVKEGRDDLLWNCWSTSETVQERKFFAHFKWYDWMTRREDYSLFIFSPTNKLRQNCLAFAEHRLFDYGILVFISLNCITLAMERPKIPPWAFERELLTAANYIFTFIFAVEMAVKVIAKGLWYAQDAYLKSGWNIMDGILVCVSLFDLSLSFFAQKSPRIFGILRVFRLLRSLRPLRVINRAPGLKLVVQTLLSSLRPIGNIVLICCTFFIIFGILGVQLFKGAFYYCEGPDVRFVKTKADCLADMRNKWVNRKYNFDNLGQALMALFVLSSKDGWVNIMYTGLDAVGVDQQPRENYNEWRLLYFISFLLLVAFFVLNMFVGVVVENFHRCREEQEKEERARRTEKRARKLEKRRRSMAYFSNVSSFKKLHVQNVQRNGQTENKACSLCSIMHGSERRIRLNDGMRELPYFIGYCRFRLIIHGLVTGKYFDVAIAGVIGLNVITMSLEYYQMPKELDYALKVFNYVFTGLFVCEALMKLYALGIKRYLKDKWNQLDVLIVILSIVGIILEEMEAELIPINPTIIRVMRLARIARVLKLLKMAKGMRALLNTVMQALPQVGNLGLLFFLLFFIFAALGVELFGRLECDEDHPCQGLSEHAHFQNFGIAFLTLFRVATGDNWNGIMKDTLRDQCDHSSDCLRNCCVSPIIAPLYFVIFVLLAQFVLVNVVVAVLMKHLEESHKNMSEDEDIEIDMKIVRELAAEKKALEDAVERKKREVELRKRKQTLTKVSSLPCDFVFYLNSEDEEEKCEPSYNKLSENGWNNQVQSKEEKNSEIVIKTFGDNQSNSKALKAYVKLTN